MSQKTISDPDAVIAGLSKVKLTRTRYSRNTRQYTQSITFDFTGCTLSEVLEWAANDRAIKFQKRLRQMESEEAFDAFMGLGKQLELFAAEANLPPEQHTDKQELIDGLTNE